MTGVNWVFGDLWGNQDKCGIWGNGEIEVFDLREGF